MKDKMLLFLSKDNPFHRILRRGLVMGGLTAIAVIIDGSMMMTPEWLVPLAVAVGAIIDKMIREMV